MRSSVLLCALVLSSACPPRPTGSTSTSSGTTADPPDASLSCNVAEDCPQTFPPCATVGGCGCGTFKTCLDNLCRSFSRDCNDGGSLDSGRPDAGEGRCLSSEECPGLFPVCDDLLCTCGSYKACHDNRCLSYSSGLCAADAGPRDASIADAGERDGGDGPDANLGQCATADDCPQFFPTCADLACTCGTYTTCFAGRCLDYSADVCPVVRDN